MVVVLALAALALLTHQDDLSGKITVSGNTATYTDKAREFSVSVPKGWWLKDAWEWSEGVHIGETKVGGGAGTQSSKMVSWDPGFIIIKLNPGSVQNLLKPWKGDANQGYLQSGKAGDVHYIAWWAGGWTIVAGYVEAPNAIWQIQVHIPKATWKEQLPLAEAIIGSFKLLTLLHSRLAPAEESARVGTATDAKSVRYFPGFAL